MLSCGTAAAEGEYWITIDTMQDTAVGVPLGISGMTNLAAGTPLDIVVRSATFSVVGEYPKKYSGTIFVTEGESGVNFWGGSTETTNWQEDQYEVIVTEQKSGVQERTYVNLCNPASLAETSSPAYRITMNEIVYPKQGTYVFFGSTTLPIESTITVDVYRIDSVISGMPEEFAPFSKIYQTFATVRSGEGGSRHWVAATGLSADRLSEKNIRYVAVAFPQDYSQIEPVMQMIPGAGSRVTIDPVADAEIGETITLSGTSNRPAGDSIPVAVYSIPRGNQPNQPKYPMVSGEAVIGADAAWSLSLNTAELRRMGTYTVVADDSPYLSGPVFSLAIPENRRWIEVDPIPFVTQNATFTLSGTTGLAAGMQLLIDILPQKFVDEISARDTKACYSSISGTTMTTVVTGGKDNVNTWSVPIDTRNWYAGIYVVKVMGVEVDVTAPREEFELSPENSVPPAGTEPPQETQAPGFAFIATLFAAAAALFLRRR